jgi:hypothetical protein
MFRIKIFLALLVLPLLIALCAGNSQKASAFNLFSRPCTGNKVEGGNSGTSPVCTASNDSKGADTYNNVVLHTINVIINIVAVVAGAAAVIIILIAGFTYTTAGGNSDDTKNARNRIIYASVGLVIIMFSWTIAHFVLNELL